MYLGYKKSNPCKKYAIKVMKKVDMINKNMASQGIFSTSHFAAEVIRDYLLRVCLITDCVLSREVNAFDSVSLSISTLY